MATPERAVEVTVYIYVVDGSTISFSLATLLFGGWAMGYQRRTRRRLPEEKKKGKIAKIESRASIRQQPTRSNTLQRVRFDVSVTTWPPSAAGLFFSSATPSSASPSPSPTQRGRPNRKSVSLISPFRSRSWGKLCQWVSREPSTRRRERRRGEGYRGGRFPPSKTCCVLWSNTKKGVKK